MVYFIDDCDSESSLRTEESVAGCAKQLAAVGSLADVAASADEVGGIARQLADYPVDWQPNRGSESTAELSFPAILDLDARLTEIAPAGRTELHRRASRVCR